MVKLMLNWVSLEMATNRGLTIMEIKIVSDKTNDFELN